MAESWGNASSVHAAGRRAKVVLEESRETIARAIGAETAEIFFTSGGTESDSHAVIGTALAQRRKTGRDHILVSAIEHHAVLESALALRSFGFRVDLIPVSPEGYVDPATVSGMVTERTALVSVMQVNNETGALQPVRECAAIAHENGAVFHTDAVQSFGKIAVEVNHLGADLLTLSAHKIHGPKGIGALYIRRGIDVDPLLHGGAQERKTRPGTENVPLIAGFAAAATLSLNEMPERSANAAECRSVLLEIVRNECPNVIVHGREDRVVSQIVSLSFDHHTYSVESETLLMNMDLRGVAVSSGSACTSGSVQPSHVLTAMGFDPKTALATVRFSFGKFTTIQEVRTAAEILCAVVRSS